MDFERQYDGFVGERGAPPGTEECLMWSAGWASGVMIVMEECGMNLRGPNPGQGAPITRSSPSMLTIAERGRRKWVWNGREAHLIDVEDGIEERPFQRRSTDRKGSLERWMIAAPVQTNDRRRELKSGNYSGGAPLGGGVGYEAAHHV